MEPELCDEHNDIHAQRSDCVERGPCIPEEDKTEERNNGSSNR
jgi:hypothetical protein